MSASMLIGAIAGVAATGAGAIENEGGVAATMIGGGAGGAGRGARSASIRTPPHRDATMEWRGPA